MASGESLVNRKIPEGAARVGRLVVGLWDDVGTVDGLRERAGWQGGGDGEDTEEDGACAGV